MAQPGTPAALSDRRWVILSAVAVAQLMVVLDATIVNIALPSAQRALAFTVPDRPQRVVETGPLVTTKSNRYVSFSAKAIDHPAGPGRVR